MYVTENRPILNFIWSGIGRDFYLVKFADVSPSFGDFCNNVRHLTVFFLEDDRLGALDQTISLVHARRDPMPLPSWRGKFDAPLSTFYLLKTASVASLMLSCCNNKQITL